MSIAAWCTRQQLLGLTPTVLEHVGGAGGRTGASQPLRMIHISSNCDKTENTHSKQLCITMRMQSRLHPMGQEMKLTNVSCGSDGRIAIIKVNGWIAIIKVNGLIAIIKVCILGWDGRVSRRVNDLHICKTQSELSRCWPCTRSRGVVPSGMHSWMGWWGRIVIAIFLDTHWASEQAKVSTFTKHIYFRSRLQLGTNFWKRPNRIGNWKPSPGGTRTRAANHQNETGRTAKKNLMLNKFQHTEVSLALVKCLVKIDTMGTVSAIRMF